MITTSPNTTIQKVIPMTKTDYYNTVQDLKASFAKEQLSKKGMGGSTMSDNGKSEWRAKFSDGSTYTFTVEPGEKAYQIAGESAREGGVKVTELICLSDKTKA